MFSIYLLTNEFNLPAYVGQTKQSVSARFKSHLRRRKDFTPTGVSLLEYCPTQDEADVMEQKWIGLFNKFTNSSLWNHTRGGQGHWPPMMVPTILEKMMVANIGKKATIETRMKMRVSRLGDKNPRFGNSHSAETRAKMRALKLGKPLSQEHRASLSAASRGKKKSPSHCAAISAGQIGKVVTLETRAKISAGNMGQSRPAWNKGIHPTLETREKMSASHKIRWVKFPLVEPKEV